MAKKTYMSEKCTYLSSYIPSSVGLKCCDICLGQGIWYVKQNSFQSFQDIQMALVLSGKYALHMSSNVASTEILPPNKTEVVSFNPNLLDYKFETLLLWADHVWLGTGIRFLIWREQFFVAHFFISIGVPPLQFVWVFPSRLVYLPFRKAFGQTCQIEWPNGSWDRLQRLQKSINFHTTWVVHRLHCIICFRDTKYYR